MTAELILQNQLEIILQGHLSVTLKYKKKNFRKMTAELILQGQLEPAAVHSITFKELSPITFFSATFPQISINFCF